MQGLAFRFFFAAAIYAIPYNLLGIHMAAAHRHTLAPVHAHINLVGWASMGLFGLYYHAVPKAAAYRLASIQFWISSIGLRGLVPGIALAVTRQFETLAAISSIVVFSGMVLFVLIVWRNRGT
ncbi:MAG: hypothetical protein WAU86_02225 [Oricola sp.]